MQFAQRTVRGVVWAYVVFLGGRLFTMVSTAVLARLLVPEDFGLVGFALLLLTFFEATRDFGISDALIYNTEREEDTATTAFWVNALIGVVQYALILLLAPWSVSIVGDVRIIPILQVIGVTFLLNALGNTHDGLLQKELQFNKRYLPELFSALIKGVLAIALAFAGYGVWSLVWSHVIGAAVRMVSKWWLMPFRPQFAFYMDRARALWNYGVYVLAFSVFTILLDQADQAIIGFLLGTAQLGYYTVAVKIPEMVIANFNLVLTRVLFPMYSKIKDDDDLLIDAFLKTTQYTAFVAVPMGLGIALIAPELTLLVFGERWEAAIPLMQVLALLGTVTALPWTAGDMLKAKGRPDISTKLLFVEALYTFPIIIYLGFTTHQAVWTSFGNLLAMCITVVLRLAVAARFLKISIWRYIPVFASSFVAGVAMVVMVLGAKQLVTGAAPILILINSIGLGALVYGGVLYALERKNLQNARSLFLSSVRGDD